MSYSARYAKSRRGSRHIERVRDGDLPGVGGTGADGDSAFQVAVAAGFTGTAAEWLESLKGPKGDDGTTGGVPDPTSQGSWIRTTDGSGNSTWVLNNAVSYIGLTDHLGVDRLTFDGDEMVAFHSELFQAFDNSLYYPEHSLVESGGLIYWNAAPTTPGALTTPEWTVVAGGGDSAYQSAVAAGFTGTVAEWLDSLKGADGAASTVPGPQGDPGADGAASTVPGPQGDPGADGAASTVPGPQGDPGADGAASTVPGPQGDPGADGAASTVPGPQGDPGADGAASTVPGPQGDPGADGAASTVPGPQGDPGADGAASTVPGPQGDPGADGAASTVPGPQGDPGADGAASTVPGPQGDPGADGAASTVPGPQGDPGADGAASTVPGPQGDPGPEIFGEGFSHINEFSESLNTGRTWLTKATLAFPVKAGETYRLGWQWQWKYDNVSYDFEGRVVLNGNQYIKHKQEPQDSSGSGTGGTDQQFQFCGFDYYGQSTDGTVTLEIQWRSSIEGVTATIWEARIEQFRVV